MKIKLIITSRLSYYFCGSISLSILNTIDNPVIVDLDKLTKQEVLGLSKAIKTKVISVIEGEAELLIKANSFVASKFKEKEPKVEEKVIEEVETKVEDIVTEVVTEVSEEVRQDVVIEEVEQTEVPVTPVRKQRTTTKK